MTPHYPERQLNLGKDFDQKCTSALWARQPNGHAIVFVHGYGGKSVATWAEFHKLLPQTPGFEHHDLIFYGYDGLNTTTNANASIFFQFLDRLFEQPLSIINPSLSLAAARPNNFRYKKVILAAHSLGAVTCRWALAVRTRQEFIVAA